jgi:hypothetical protein
MVSRQTRSVLAAGTPERSLARVTGAIDVLRPDAPKRVVINRPDSPTPRSPITGEQQYSGGAAARLIVEALGA